MSEPVSNAEIEDVLSSIRRLVSENTGPDRSPSDVPETSEKLVLTPAFRVLDKDEAPQDLPVDTPEAEAPAPETDEADFSQEDASADSDASAAETPEMDLEARIAELETAIDDTFEEWEPDGSEEDAQAPDPAILNHGGVFDSGPEPTPDSSPESVPEAEIFQPEDAFVDDSEWDEPEILEAEHIPDEDDLNITGGLDDGEAFLDEDSLREMVSQLVREELQGHVGERITRNVRRLVRREIKRALSIRDLE